MPPKPSRPKIERPPQETPKEMVESLLNVIRNQFYGDAPEKKWFQDQHFLKVNVVLWPAEWLDERALRLPPTRYKAILIGIFNDVKNNGATDAVKYWPGYLKKCVQSHFGLHTEEIIAEARSTPMKLDVALGAVSKFKIIQEDTTTDVLAAARKLLIREKKERKKAKAEKVAEKAKSVNLLPRPSHKAEAETQAQGELF